LRRPPGTVPADASFVAFPDFGLFVWNRPRFRLVLRCGSVGQNGNGGHAHSDQLAITLDVDGRAVLIDPGTGLYTPDPAIRNRLRSAASHSTILVPGREPNEWQEGRWGLFSMADRSRARLVRCDEAGAVAEHEGYGGVVRREIRIGADTVEIRDSVPENISGAFSQWVLAPELRASIEEGGCHLGLPGSGGGAVLRMEGAGISEVRIESSPHYGAVVETSAIRCRGPRVKITIR
jgi:hypothetical protein